MSSPQKNSLSPSRSFKHSVLETKRLILSCSVCFFYLAVESCTTCARCFRKQPARPCRASSKTPVTAWKRSLRSKGTMRSQHWTWYVLFCNKHLEFVINLFVINSLIIYLRTHVREVKVCLGRKPLKQTPDQTARKVRMIGIIVLNSTTNTASVFLFL